MIKKILGVVVTLAVVGVIVWVGFDHASYKSMIPQNTAPKPQVKTSPVPIVQDSVKQDSLQQTLQDSLNVKAQ